MVMPSSVRLRNGCQNVKVLLRKECRGARTTRYARRPEVQQVIDTPEGQFTITFTPKEKEAVLDRHSQQAFGNGYLSVEQANLILNHLPMEITFVNKDDIFQYYNDNMPADEMIFKRTPSQVGAQCRTLSSA